MSAMAVKALFICACGDARADHALTLRCAFTNLNNEKARENARISQSPRRHSISIIEITSRKNQCPRVS